MIITNKKQLEKYTAPNRIWQGIPGIAKTKGGRLFCTYYSGGTREQLGNYVILSQSDDDGKTWIDPVAVAYAGQEARCYDSNVWVDPLGRLWLYWAVAPDHNVVAAICENPDGENFVFSEPFTVGDADVMLNKPTVLSSGEWLFPMAVWNNSVELVIEQQTKKTPGSYVYKSCDNGETFINIGKADIPNRSYDEHMIVELRDGHLEMYVRTTYGIGKSSSYDGGITWTKGEPSEIAGPSSRFFITRLKSGRHLLVNHYKFNGRNNLTALISDDNCKTWHGELMLDERANVSYPDGFEDENGYIYITYDRERGAFLSSYEQARKCAREVLFAKFTEDDVLNGKIVSQGSKLKQVISKLDDYEGDDPNPYGNVSLMNDSEYVLSLMEFDDGNKIIKKILSDYGKNCKGRGKGDNLILDKNMELILVHSKSKNKEELKKCLSAVVKILRHNTVSSTAYENLFADIVAYIDSHISDNLTLETLCAQFNISKFYMSHMFKDKTNLTLIKYVVARRIFNAKLLLVGTSLPIFEIAEKCGFADAYYFSKVFKSYEGEAPSDYRKFHR